VQASVHTSNFLDRPFGKIKAAQLRDLTPRGDHRERRDAQCRGGLRWADTLLVTHSRTGI
ncbi:MAG: hypothetical protein ABI468_01960, partial [Candidatus Nanopelagicales bacterium]